jgi:hypothetical protein
LINLRPISEEENTYAFLLTHFHHINNQSSKCNLHNQMFMKNTADIYILTQKK